VSVAQRHPGGNDRNRELARIHLLKSALKMADDAYRGVVASISNQRTRSSGKLTAPERRQLIAHLVACTGKRPGPAKKNVASDKAALMGKIGSMLAAQGRDWPYIDAVALRMFKVERAEWCDKYQLHGLVGILAKDARRHDRPA
jgi:phage gp16-like protein